MVEHPRPFPGIPNKAVASYDYSDIASGIGIEIYYPTVTTVAGAFTYTLQRNAIIPGNTDPTTVTDHELRSYLSGAAKEFILQGQKLSRTVTGNAFVAFTITTTTAQSGGDTTTVTIKKNSTSIGSTTVDVAGTSTKSTTYLVQIALTESILAVGDTLSVHFEVTTVGSTSRQFLLHDNLSRDVVTYTPAGGVGNLPGVTNSTNHTILEAHIPYKLTNI